jgi:hypothetical protein
MLLVRRAACLFRADHGEDVGDQVRQRVDRIGDQRLRMADDSEKELDDRENDVGRRVTR